MTLQEAWDFFSSPVNLAKITPPHMAFKIQYISGDSRQMYPGQIIRYRIGILPGITTDWMTEITHVNEPHYFVDEQRFGPYALWHHQHSFRETEDGVEMTDEINYAIPYGIIGRLANWVFVENEVKAIFEYRREKIEKLFSRQRESVNITL